MQQNCRLLLITNVINRIFIKYGIKLQKTIIIINMINDSFWMIFCNV